MTAGRAVSRRMKCVLAAVAGSLLGASGVAAAGYGERPIAGQADMMRKLWASQKAGSMAVVQQVYSRTVSFQLPRPFVPGYQAQGPGSYLAEYVPDGQTVEKWTRMITVSGRLGGGAAQLNDGELAAAFFDNLSCPGKLYRDLGSASGHRIVVIGCATAGAADSERGAIAMFRDAENMWTVQYAERGAMTANFEARAAAEIARLAPFVTCKDGETAAVCGKPAK